MSGQLDSPSVEVRSHSDALRGPVERLIRRVESLPSLETDDPSSPRDELLALLTTKILPECSTTALPLFVAVQGGANVGKSTMFNALAGQLISPVAVQASSTRHPLVYTHERWRDVFLTEPCFTAIECRQLSDPQELLSEQDRTDLFYFSFHGDDRLSGIALIDSPDLDSFVVQNVVGAARIGTIGDISVFVTTAQKYKDRVLVEHLIELLTTSAAVLVLFNQLNEEIVFETLLSDLKSVLPGDADLAHTSRVPTIVAPHPEEKIGESLRSELLPMFGALDSADVKRTTVSAALGAASRLARETLAQLQHAAEEQKELRALIEAGVGECIREYETSSRIAFPEETVALKRLLRFTELGSLMQVATRVESASTPFSFVGTALRNCNRVLRRVVVRLTGKHEGVVEGEEETLKSYARIRDESDGENASRCVESLRVKIDSDLRTQQITSPLARSLLANHLTPQYASSFADTFREHHTQQLAATPNTGEDLLPHIESWLTSNGKKLRALGILAILFKLGCAFLVASTLPSGGGGILALFNVLTWIYFVCGYFAASYVVAIIITLLLPGKRRFLSGRLKAFSATVSELLTQPLYDAMDRFLRDEDCRELDEILKEFDAAARNFGSE